MDYTVSRALRWKTERREHDSWTWDSRDCVLSNSYFSAIIACLFLAAFWILLLSFSSNLCSVGFLFVCFCFLWCKGIFKELLR